MLEDPSAGSTGESNEIVHGIVNGESLCTPSLPLDTHPLRSQSISSDFRERAFPFSPNMSFPFASLTGHGREKTRERREQRYGEGI